LEKIKSAYEMALERFEQRAAVSPEELERTDNLQRGKTMAAEFLRDSKYDLDGKLKEKPAHTHEYLIEGMADTFIKNIQLPTDSASVETNLRAISGLMIIKKQKEKVLAVFEQLKHLFTYYEKASIQTYDQLKEEYRAKIIAKAKSMGYGDVVEQNVDPERYAGFREDWMKIRMRLNDQYQGILIEQKDKLRQVD